MKVAVLEPPFLEPGLPRPEPFHFAEIIRRHGHDAIVVDANMLVYRGLVSEPAANLLCAFEPERVASTVRRALALPDPYAAPHGMSSAVDRAVRAHDVDTLARLMDGAVVRMSSGGLQGHAGYIRDVELTNAFLELAMARVDDGVVLSLHGIDGGPPPGDSREVLSWVGADANPLGEPFDRFVAPPVLAAAADRVVVVISQEAQLAGGLSLANWARARGMAVTVTGDFLDRVRERYDPPTMPGVVGNLLSGSFEESAAVWLGSAPSMALPAADAIPLVRPVGYFSPLPVVGAALTRRCYWARCGFCQVASLPVSRSPNPSVGALATALDRLAAIDVHHLQFFDYAISPTLLSRIAEAGYRGIDWCGQVRFEPALEQDGLFERVRAAGCVGLSWGFETASDRLLAASGKGGLSGPARTRMLRAAAEAGLHNHVFAIAGLPSESDADFAATLQWLEDALPWLSSGEAHAFQLQWGTRFHLERSKLGLVAATCGDWELNIPYNGDPSPALARERAHTLNEVLRAIASLHGTNDWLEGHMVFAGPRA